MLEIGMWWLVISTWKQSQSQSKQQEAGSKQEAKWIQTGCKVDAKWKQSMEHARRNGFATEPLMPLGGKPEGLLPLGDKFERLLPPIANQPQDVITRLVNSSQLVMGKVMIQPICHHFCHHLPLPRKAYIAGHQGLISLSPLMYYFTSMQATRYIVTHTRDSNSQYHQRNSYTISLGWYLNRENGGSLFW